MTKTPKELAEEYAGIFEETVSRDEKLTKERADCITYRFARDIYLAAFLAGRASLDAEVRELIQAIRDEITILDVGTSSRCETASRLELALKPFAESGK